MRTVISLGAGVVVALAAFVPAATAKGPAKAPPACSAITFRSLAAGMTDGEHEAGMYKSRYGRLELYGEVKQGPRSTITCSRAASASPPLPAASPRRLSAVPRQRRCRSPRRPLRPAPASAFGSSSPTRVTSGWHCFIAMTAAVGISALPAPSNTACRCFNRGHLLSG